MRQRTYSRGGNGRNGARRYQSRARELQARRKRSRARRGFTSARRARRAVSSGQPARGPRPLPSRLELPGARLVPPGAVPAVAAARVRALAHVHRLRRRRRYTTARRRRTVRKMASRDDETRKKDVEQHRHTETSRRTVALKRRGLELGFDAVGVASLERSAHDDELDQWLAAGYAGSMAYLHRQADKRKHPARIMPDARVAVVTPTNYFHGSAHSVHPGLAPGVSAPASAGRVAQYAWSTDYHTVIGRRLEQLATAVREIAPGARTRCYVDAGPVPERELAQRAGLGWIAKNTMLIHPAIGSFTFIGVIFTDAELVPDLPFEADRCGTCRRCLDACPTAAFVESRVLDARRCISYLTIEHAAPFRDDERRLVGDWLFGCDVCQDVCPWNVTFAEPTSDPELAVRADVAAPDPAELLAGAPQEFQRP